MYLDSKPFQCVTEDTQRLKIENMVNVSKGYDAKFDFLAN